MKYNKKIAKHGLGDFVGAASQLGSLIPGIGPAISAVGGIAANLIGAGQRKKAQKLADAKQKELEQDNYTSQFNSQLDNSNQNPFGNQLFALGGLIGPDDPTKPKAKPRPYQPDITLPGWDGLVQKDDGSIGMWGNDINKVPPTVIPKVEIPLGSTDHLGRQSGHLYQGTPVVRDKIFEMEKRLKAQSNMKGYAQGSDVTENQINIEKGELQIDPQTGKILREYKGINPETGGLYEAHSKKGQDTQNNIVNAMPGTFIITKAKAKQYKDAVDNNDKITKSTVLQNIRNKKAASSQTYADGDFVLNDSDRSLMAGAESGVSFAPTAIPTQSAGKFDPSSLIGLAPGLINMFQGAKAPNKMERVASIINPMKNKVLNNLPTEVSLAPIKNEINKQQASMFNQINNSTSSAAVARANKNNVFSNTTEQLGKLGIDQQMSNNQIKTDIGRTYNQLGSQDMQAQSDARNYNYQIDNVNDMKDLAKQQQSNLGISQLQELYLNNKKNKSLSAMDLKRIEALKLIFPRLSQEEYANMLAQQDK